MVLVRRRKMQLANVGIAYGGPLSELQQSGR